MWCCKFASIASTRLKKWSADFQWKGLQCSFSHYNALVSWIHCGLSRKSQCYVLRKNTALPVRDYYLEQFLRDNSTKRNARRFIVVVNFVFVQRKCRFRHLSMPPYVQADRPDQWHDSETAFVPSLIFYLSSAALHFYFTEITEDGCAVISERNCSYWRKSITCHCVRIFQLLYHYLV